jgi:hypothetical protein
MLNAAGRRCPGLASAGTSANVKFLPPRGFYVKKIVLDISKARKALNWTPLCHCVKAVNSI